MSDLPPSDLEELELQAVIAQKSHEIFHGQGVVLALTDVELHSEEILTVPWDEEANDQIHQAYHSKRCHQNSWC